MTRVKTVDARTALAAIVEANARAAAGSNTLVARAEEAKLEPYLAERSTLLRSEGGKGTRVRVEPLVERTLVDAESLWSKHNPASNPASARYLSKAEIKSITKESPALGAITRLAYERVASGGAQTSKAAVESFFSTYDFAPDDTTGLRPLAQGLPGATVLDGRSAAVRATLPLGVRTAFDLYAKLQDADIGNVYLQRAPIGGHEVLIVYGVTDGDPGFLEVFDKSGKPISSARLNGDRVLAFDEVFGRARFHPTVAHAEGVLTEEGLSEPDDQAAAGQPPTDWQGVLRTSQGRLHYDPTSYRLKEIELPITQDDPRYEVAAAAFEYLFETSLKHRLIGGDEPFRLGSMREGELVLGPFARNDGKTYEVAKWRDIDDGSFTLYFERTQEGRLRLHTSQFDN